MKMYRHGFVAAFLAACLWGGAAATPPAPQLLPPDTLALLSMPDWSQIRSSAATSPVQLLWNDPLMRPFRDKLVKKLETEVFAKLEKDTGIKLAEYAELLQGQLSLAITRNGWTGTPDPLPGLVLILDARDKAPVLTAKLTDLRKRITDAGQTLKTEKVRDIEFTRLTLNPDAESGAAEAGSVPKLSLAFGQVGSVLVAGMHTRDLERVVGRLGGAGMPHLGEEAAFAADQQAFFRDTQVYGWIHFAPLAEVLTKIATTAAGAAGEDSPVQPDKLIGALGLKGLKTLAFGARDTAEGSLVDLNLNAPSAERKGLLKLLTTEAKDAGIPAFVPADAVAFWRWRLDGKKLWATLEGMMNEIQPGILDFVVAQLDAGLKERDPNLDFKRSFILNLGDDLIGYQKAPKSAEPKDLLSQPSLFLLGSANVDPLLSALRSALALFPTPIKDREFLGRRIYTLTLPDLTGSGSPSELHLAASGGYLAIAGEASTLEEYLRSSDTKPKPLAETPGLREAAQKLGGTGSGLFGFQNDAEQLRPYWDAVRANPGLFFGLATAQNPALGEALGEDQKELEQKVAEWVDFALLPEFSKVAKYFHLTVYTGTMSSGGYTLRTFTPLPPQLRR
ncbi:MAG: hypothetical protein HS113_08185 [Verrucomicrobiales bacterium]|nr:hypothetical protein [Verrucomicrobiales bacterium]